LKAGFWLNGVSRSSSWVEVDDHERSMRNDPAVARLMGISGRLLSELSARHPDREKFLISVMQRGAIRVRGHSTHITVEYWSRTIHEPEMLSSISRFAEEVLAPTSLLRLVNLRMEKGRSLRASELLC
jgi:hypothetical protein